MRLHIVLPTATIVDVEVDKVIAETEHGSFCLLPRHVDYVAPLVPSLLCYGTAAQDEEYFVAVDRGLLVKVDAMVTVSTPRATEGAELSELRATVEAYLESQGEREQHAWWALEKVQADFTRRFMQLEERR